MSNQIPSPEEPSTVSKDADIKPTLTDSYKYNQDYHKVADFLGVTGDDKMDEDIAGKISFLTDYTGKSDPLDVMVAFRDMIRELGVSMQGPELVKMMYKYARLAQERKNIDKEIDLLVRKS